MHVYPNVPFKNGGRITTGFTAKHKAKDITPRNDDDGQVFAIESGTVTDTEDSMSQGDDHANVVIVRGSDQALTVYAHVSPSVSASSKVKKGDKIGDVDLSGDSTGRHVHLARLPAGDGSVQGVIDRQDTAVFFEFKSLKPW
jgi:murein DD-endopeptidase MepM/ murein hydrolase activator NlpD